MELLHKKAFRLLLLLLLYYIVSFNAGWGSHGMIACGAETREGSDSKEYARAPGGSIG